MRLTSAKVHLSKTIHDWHRPRHIVSYRAIIYASFSKRAPMTVTLSNKQVNNTLIASRQAYIYMLQEISVIRDSSTIQGLCVIPGYLRDYV